MDRINGAGTIDIGGGRRGFRDENLEVGNEGTEVTALFMNMVQEEIIKVITSAGLNLDPADWTQLYQALRILGFSSSYRRWTSVISMTLSSAPGAPTVGDTYLIPAAATGTWAGNVGKIAEWNGAAWSYVTPPDGHGISLPDGRVYERIAGAYTEKLALDSQSGKWNYAVAGGSANALTISLAPAPAALAAGARVVVKITAANTGAMTLDTNGLGAVSIVLPDGSAVPSGTLSAGQLAVFVHDGTKWQWQSSFRPATQAEMDAGTRSDVFASPATIKDKAIVLFGFTFAAAQSAPNGVSTVVTNLTLSDNALVDSTVSGGVITIGPKDAGLWLVSGSVGASVPGTSNTINCEIYVGATRKLVGVAVSNTSYSGLPSAVGFVRLVAGDQLKMHVLQTSGAAANINVAAFSGTRLGK